MYNISALKKVNIDCIENIDCIDCIESIDCIDLHLLTAYLTIF
jgi:hypothetical protein